jgi:hypothetical protein
LEKATAIDACKPTQTPLGEKVLWVRFSAATGFQLTASQASQQHGFHSIKIMFKPHVHHLPTLKGI